MLLSLLKDTQRDVIKRTSGKRLVVFLHISSAMLKGYNQLLVLCCISASMGYRSWQEVYNSLHLWM